MKSRFSSRTVAVFAVVFVSAFAGFAQGQPPAGRPVPPAPSSLQNLTQPQLSPDAKTTSPAEKYFSDVELINQDGKKMRFYSDVLKGKVVIVNTFFATCTSVCPPMNRNMEKIQEALGDRLGKDAFLVSISVDPEMDTPPRLKEYGRRFHARSGWIFLTGKKENLDWALYKLGQYVEQKNDHSTIIIIGNEPKGLWKKAIGLAKPNELIAIVEDVLNDR
ncbi:MAG: SCO family protein [Acidobacteriota bacterium]